LESHDDQIAELSYQGGWDPNPDMVAEGVRIGATQPLAQQVEYSAVAASRDTKADPYRPNCVFYQPGPNVIDVTPVAADDGWEYDREAEKVVAPRGIPKSHGILNNPIPQPSNPAGTQGQVARLTAALENKDAEINRLTGLLTRANVGGLSPSDFGSDFTTWQDVKADYDRTKADLIACSAQVASLRDERNRLKDENRLWEHFRGKGRLLYGFVDTAIAAGLWNVDPATNMISQGWLRQDVDIVLKLKAFIGS
jgi:hypothetical protein